MGIKRIIDNEHVKDDPTRGDAVPFSPFRRNGVPERPGPDRRAPSQGLSGFQCALGFPVELGRAEDHLGIRPEDLVPQPDADRQVSRLRVQFRGRHQVFLDEGVPPRGLRTPARTHPGGTLAHLRQQLGGIRRERPLPRVAHPQHPDGSALLPGGVRRHRHGHLPSRLLWIRTPPARRRRALRTDRLLHPEIAVAGPELARNRQQSSFRNRPLARPGRQSDHDCARRPGVHHAFPVGGPHGFRHARAARRPQPIRHLLPLLRHR